MAAAHAAVQPQIWAKLWRSKACTVGTGEGIILLGRIFRCLSVLLMLAFATVDVVAQAEPVPAHQNSMVIALPEPTGTEGIGVVDLHLVDASRHDPYIPDRLRELMISIWYPAIDVAGVPVRSWLAPDLARMYAEGLIHYGIPMAVPWILAPSHGHVDAPADVAGGGRPVMLFSPGLSMPRELSTAQAEDLASHGFIVVTSSYTYETFATQFPDGRIEKSVLPPATDRDQTKAQVASALPIRVADTRFVLDKLADIAAGDNPDADRHPLPDNLARILDVSKVAMFGHSLGGTTAAQSMHDDRRILAGANLDGVLSGSVVIDGLDRPFMLVGAENHGRDNDPTWQQFRANDHGPKLDFRLDGAQHLSFCDNQLIVPPLAAAGITSSENAAQLVGTIDPRDSLDLQRGYLRTFFDTTLGRYDDLPQAPVTLLHPEMVPVP
ncbi:alpha/beta hydrolase family protein [Nocardia sp. NPDC051570]|uniref:alpha/beta hydrolase family protein n=1 Tax=Nocardia sp. NPDC051570 TaxID=3364324 RepID=UPI0037B71B5A